MGYVGTKIKKEKKRQTRLDVSAFSDSMSVGWCRKGEMTRALKLEAQI